MRARYIILLFLSVLCATMWYAVVSLYSVMLPLTWVFSALGASALTTMTVVYCLDIRRSIRIINLRNALIEESEKECKDCPFSDMCIYEHAIVIELDREENL